MNLAFVEHLVRTLESSTAQELEYQEGTERLRLCRSMPFDGGSTAAQAVAAPAVAAAPSGIAIASPATGRFFATHPLFPRDRSFPVAVARGELVGFLQVGAFLSGVEAPADGQLVQPCVDDGTLVGHGDELFRFQPGGRGSEGP